MNNRTNGTFVEIGALYGHTLSNTRMLNFCYGWNGLLIEANLVNYVQLIKKFDRPNTRVIHSAVCEKPQSFVPFTNEGGAVAKHKNNNITSLLNSQGYSRCHVPDRRNAWFRKKC